MHQDSIWDIGPRTGYLHLGWGLGLKGGLTEEEKNLLKCRALSTDTTFNIYFEQKCSHISAYQVVTVQRMGVAEQHMVSYSRLDGSK
jgi:hypothetical protein